MSGTVCKKIVLSCMLLFAAFFCLRTGVYAGERGDAAQSFRYGAGAEGLPDSPVSLMNAGGWQRVGNAYYNGNGQAINGAYARGIDVSSNNGSIDWQAVKADGVDFAIIRCGYGMDQPEQDDIRYLENVAGCEAAGIPYGVYIYSYADTVERAVSEADHVLRLIRGRNLSYPVYFDMEDQSIFSKTTPQQREQIASAFLAHYSDQCGYAGTYQMWQATNQGMVAGIQGPVDINFLISDQIFVKPEIKKAVTAGKKAAKVSWKPKKKGTVCEIAYSRKKKGGYKVLTKNAKKGSVKVRKLKSGKKYYFKVRMRRVVNGVTVYSKYSKIKTLRIR